MAIKKINSDTKTPEDILSELADMGWVVPTTIRPMHASELLDLQIAEALIHPKNKYVKLFADQAKNMVRHEQGDQLRKEFNEYLEKWNG